jgi:membrane protease YdiL (CAAX protease family)
MSDDSSKIPVPTKSADTAAQATDPSQVKWGPTAALIISVVAFVGGFLLAGLIAYAVADALGKDAVESKAWLSSVTGQFIFVIIAEGLLVGAIAIFLKHRKTNLKAVGFHRPPNLWDALLALMGFVVYFVMLIAASVVAKSVFNVDVDQKQELGFDSVITNGQMILTFISLVVLPPIAEEILFRGFLYTGLRKKLPYIYTAIFVSLIFASLHLLESSSGLLWIAGIDTFILSMVLCHLREKTGNLWAGIVVHALKNGLAFIFLYVITTA